MRMLFIGGDIVRALDLSTVSEQQVSFKVQSPSFYITATKHTAGEIADIVNVTGFTLSCCIIMEINIL